MTITIRDLAHQLNLFIMTVFRTPDGRDDVSKETPRRVIAAAVDLGYVPGCTARHLCSHRVDAIGCLLPTSSPRFSDPFYDNFFDESSLRAPKGRGNLLAIGRLLRSPALACGASVARTDGFAYYVARDRASGFLADPCIEAAKAAARRLVRMLITLINGNPLEKKEIWAEPEIIWRPSTGSI